MKVQHSSLWYTLAIITRPGYNPNMDSDKPKAGVETTSADSGKSEPNDNSGK